VIALAAAVASYHDPLTLYRHPVDETAAVWSLPFTLEACTDDHGNTGFVAAGAEGGLAPPGVVVTDWNDVPMEEAVDIRAERRT
jgi:hypothetical protein